jgi:hypothetical protein
MSDKGESFYPFHEHWRSSLNRAAVNESEQCGCYSCKRIFASNLIREWCDDGKTALCPYCSVDAVVPELKRRGFVVTPEYLRAMHDYWMATR